MSSRLVAASMIFALAAASANADEKRQLDAHEHGHGTLNIAVEGKSVHIELEVPGADIVGFEHAARSEDDKAKIAAAKKVLSAATTLFAFSAGAGCTLAEAKVEQESGEGHASDHASHGHKEHGHKENGHKERDHKDHAEHSEFHAKYVFNCKSPGALASIGFPYFDVFANAEELDVTLITEKGQKAFEVNREQKRIDLQGMM